MVSYLNGIYSGILKSDHSKSGLFEDWISNGWTLAKAITKVPTIWKPDHSKLGHVCLNFKCFFLQNGGHLSGFQMVGLLDLRSHSKTGPFATQPLLTIQNPDQSGFQIPTVVNQTKDLVVEWPHDWSDHLNTTHKFAIQKSYTKLSPVIKCF